MEIENYNAGFETAGYFSELNNQEDLSLKTMGITGMLGGIALVLAGDTFESPEIFYTGCAVGAVGITAGLTDIYRVQQKNRENMDLFAAGYKGHPLEDY